MLRPGQKKKLQSMDLLHMGREELAADKDAAMDKLSQAKDKRLNRGAEPGQETAAQKAMDEDPGLFITFLRARAPPLTALFPAMGCCMRETLSPSFACAIHLGLLRLQRRLRVPPAHPSSWAAPGT